MSEHVLTTSARLSTSGPNDLPSSEEQDRASRPPDPAAGPELLAELERCAKRHDDEIVAFRRDLHAHPELGGHETRTTRMIAARLSAAGITWSRIASGTGLIAEVAGRGAAKGAPVIALRADIDALPLQDAKDVPYRSTVPGVCHACGHDVHTAALVGAGLVLTDLANLGVFTGRVRLIFQPAEEIIPDGATDAIASGAVDGVQRIFGLHCDPHEPVGKIGLKVGGLTASADQVTIRLAGPGGHTARPHLTADLIYALGEVATRLPGILSRRVDPRAGLSLVWGRIAAGATSNVIPQSGEISGTVRSLDVDSWELANTLVPAIAREILHPLGVTAEVDYVRGVPPVMNEASSVSLLDRAAKSILGDDAVVPTPQSLGGEDFAWYLERVPGAMARLGVRGPGVAEAPDIHRAEFDVDERAIGIGTRLHVAAALAALDA